MCIVNLQSAAEDEESEILGEDSTKEPAASNSNKILGENFTNVVKICAGSGACQKWKERVLISVLVPFRF